MPAEQRDALAAEMRAAGVDWRLVVHGGALHAFHHPPVDQTTVPGVAHHPRHEGELLGIRQPQRVRAA